ncbi:MAG: PEGA domain-containing protein, partial [Deltaproteobacteria bacterium]|nr:PEGA domain-containing protein [Deltaproteobacteria bacterium]
MTRWLLALVVVVAATAGQAQDAKKEAQTFFRSGERAFTAGQYSSAAQAFEEAYKRFKSPAIAFSAAQAYRLQYFVDKKPRNLKRAVELYRGYLKVVSSGGRRADAVANLAELEPILQRLEAETEIDMSGPVRRVTKLLITSDLKGTRVRVNGAAASSMPWAKEVTPGKYRIQVTKKGYFPYEDTREVFDGQFRV